MKLAQVFETYRGQSFLLMDRIRETDLPLSDKNKLVKHLSTLYETMLLAEWMVEQRASGVDIDLEI